MARFLRYLRIAFSATCLIACVLLIVLWVRSYTWADVLPISTERVVISQRGQIGSFHWPLSHPVSERIEYELFLPNSFLGFGHTEGMAAVPHWFPLVLFVTVATFAIAPWLPRRFSLRTLLIVTTLIAALLGLIVYATK